MSRKISNYENFAHSSADHNRKRYTVERTESSVSHASSKIEHGGQFVEVFLSVLKWLTAALVLSVVVFCVAASKICLLVLGQQFKTFNQTRTSVLKETSVETRKQASILMLVLALMIPQVATLVYATWTNLRRKSRPWPTKQGFILILIGGFLETLSLCYITIVGLTVLPIDPSAIVLLMCSLAVFPSIYQAITSRSRFNSLSGKLLVFKFSASAVIAVLGIALLTWKTPDMSGRIGIPIAFVLLSIAWSPKLRKHQIRSKHQSAKTAPDSTMESSVSDKYDNDAEQGVTQGPPVKRRTARGKAAIVSSLWRLVLTPFTAVMFIKLYNIVELDSIFAGFRDINVSNPSFVYFMLHVFASFFGYHFGWLACSLCLQRVGYALPLTLATPIVILMIQVRGICETQALPLTCTSDDQIYILSAGALLWVTQFVSITYYVWKGEGKIMAKAQDLFWIPDYNGVCLEQYLLLNRRNEASDEEHVTQQNLSKDIRVFICTTMYHEEDYEMEQLLRSIHDVDMNTVSTGHQFESHVFFDGCVRVEVLNSYALKLASLVEKTLKVRLTECSKMKTPYGMQLKWRLPGGMEFIVHLKDNAKVKNKKRWSQVMYMSYVLDYKQRLLGVKDEQSFILTTDADVKFTHESVEALIDQIIEDPRIGAVCARTHPLGNGPVVWYQIFDYAIGHWFQKVANHMLGSVLCSPGCFSLYRCSAVREVLPTYATGVDHAFEFLTKDMGEDRWMCTLMIQRGWRLTYCAAAEDSTYCPESFDELYKQRRRWTPSTLANLVLLVSEWKRILKNNDHISFLFILYQAFLVCSTVIGPSTVILVIVGGMMFSGLAVNEVTTVVLVSLVVVLYTLICLFTSQDFQLKVSKLLTFVFAVIMCIVFIGVAVQIANEIKSTGRSTLERNSSDTPPESLEQQLPAGASTLYLAGLSGIFIAAALLHPNEFTCLFHGVWYLLCLPSGYLLLTIYSLCNLTDRSWGTREEKSASQEEAWYKPIANLLSKICKCCQSRQTQEEGYVASQAKRGSIVESRTSIKAELTNSSNKVTESSDENRNKEMTSFTAKGEVFIKTETTEVLRLPAEDTQTSKNLEATKPEKKSTKNQPNNLVSGTNEQTSVATSDGAEQNYRFPTIVVHSTPEIPRKSLASSSKTESKEAWKLSTAEVSEEHSLDSAFHQPSSSASIDPAPGSYTQGLLREKIETGDGVKREKYPFAKDHSVNSVVHEGTMPQKSGAGQEIGDGEMQKQKGKRKLIVSSLITSSASMFQESPDQFEKRDGQLMKNPELSLKFGSNLSIRTLDENGRPMTALKNDVSFSDKNLPVEEWLTRDFKRYASNFREHGYDTAGFLPGMTDKDLQLIGIHTRGHRQRLLRDIRKIPRLDIEEDIPQNVQEWLEEHGLGDYWPKFESSGYTEPSDLEDLKNINKDNLKETFNIHKPGHFNRLLSAIRKLQYPNQGQIRLRQTRRELDRLPLLYLDVDNQDEGIEYEFWEGLRQTCLVPELSAFDQTSKLKEKLVELRNTALLIFGVSNALWMVIVLTLVQQKDLKVFGVDVIGLAFLLIYGFLIILQFLALLGHRFKTIVHILARTPWTLSKRIGNNRVESSFEFENSHPTS